MLSRFTRLSVEGLDTAIFTKARIEIARNGSRTIIGPWSHSGRGGQKVGKIDYDPEAKINLAAEDLRWFDYWLKGKGTGINNEAPVRILSWATTSGAMKKPGRWSGRLLGICFLTLPTLSFGCRTGVGGGEGVNPVHFWD